MMSRLHTFILVLALIGCSGAVYSALNNDRDNVSIVVKVFKRVECAEFFMINKLKPVQVDGYSEKFKCWQVAILAKYDVDYGYANRFVELGINDQYFIIDSLRVGVDPENGAKYYQIPLGPDAYTYSTCLFYSPPPEVLKQYTPREYHVDGRDCINIMLAVRYKISPEEYRKIKKSGKDFLDVLPSYFHK